MERVKEQNITRTGENKCKGSNSELKISGEEGGVGARQEKKQERKGKGTGKRKDREEKKRREEVGGDSKENATTRWLSCCTVFSIQV